ncbi:MAG: glycosyltransferase [Chlorobium sp.]|uniref:glycosyltransferase n=1 Tax=Chlorobium sp. TaxID=1095 RepID=UPI0025B9EE71|nr:glycosyltransferase [Chlorobium sp.]MCF8382608.1 glycosyltransferase [Chlorobium sp.]
MKILFMNSARTWGGTEKWTRMAAESLKNAGHYTILVYRRDVVGKNFTIPKFRLPIASHIDLYTLYKLVQLIRKEKIEIIIPTKRKDYFLAGIAGRITKTPVIVRLGADRRLHWPWQRLMYSSLPAGLIVNAEKIKDTLLQTGWFRKERIKVIYNGLDTEEIDRLKHDPAEKPYPFTIGALGRITRNKGFDYLIRSFALFLRQNPHADAGLVIMGEGADQPEFEALASKLGIAHRVRFTGFIANPYPMLQKYDIFTMTSTNEGLSNALLEAMYLDCAPVSTIAGGVREVIDESSNGFLVDYGNEERLASIIEKLYCNENERKIISCRAKETVVRQFTVPVMTESIAAFCKEIAKNPL